MSGAAAGRDALAAGRLMEAVDETRDALAADPGDADALYVQALALARLGAEAPAAAALARLLALEDPRPALRADALALSGRLLKSRFARERDPAVALQASRAYEEALRLAPGAFFAVNAATLHRLAGDVEGSRALAREAETLVGSEQVDHWAAATLGECSALLGDFAGARERYLEAAARAAGRHGDVASMRRQLRLLAAALPEAQALLEAIPAPRVVAFSGHMIDAPGRAVPRFPAALESRVAEAIEAWAARTGPVIGYAQAACGSDILFLEALQSRGHETHVTLPCATQDYLVQSVAFAGAEWVARFERALARATSVVHATAEAYLGDQVLFEHASRFIDGRAILRARQLEADASMLVVLDLGAPALKGGARETFEEWVRAGRPGEVIDLAALRAQAPPAPAAPQGASRAVAAEAAAGRQVCGLVFCDVRGFSRITEAYSPRFQERFLGEARRVIDGLPEFRTAQTAGDGIYATFATVPAAAEFSLQLCERVRRVDWTEFGLPADTDVRVALHCGPVFPIDDPVTGLANFCGTHVNRTARIEPVVTPGEVFATEMVAAYLALQAPAAFECDYLGVLALAKGAGSAPLYRLRRVQPAEASG